MNNKCVHFSARSEHYSKYFYCRKNRKKIDYEDCKICNDKEYKKQKQLTKKTTKLQRLENERFSILTQDMENCFICKRGVDCDKHEIFPGANRKRSIKWGLVVPLCRLCHEEMDYDKELISWLQCLGQDKFVEIYGLEKFIQEFGQDYKIKHK